MDYHQTGLWTELAVLSSVKIPEYDPPPMQDRIYGTIYLILFPWNADLATNARFQQSWNSFFCSIFTITLPNNVLADQLSAWLTCIAVIISSVSHSLCWPLSSALIWTWISSMLYSVFSSFSPSPLQTLWYAKSVEYGTPSAPVFFSTWRSITAWRAVQSVTTSIKRCAICASTCCTNMACLKRRWT